MLANLDLLFGLILVFILLLILQRSLHKELFILLFLVTHRADFAAVIFSVFVFPGVLLHETSHFLAAMLLGVKTGGFSIIPRIRDKGELQLGFVETARVDWVRDALIGAAPLIIGGGFVAYISIAKLRVPAMLQVDRLNDFRLAVSMLEGLIRQPDFWIWFYLALVISSTMLPSSSDRRVWLPVGLTLTLILGISLLIGAGPWLIENLAIAFNRALRTVLFILAVSVLLHFIILPFVWAARKTISKLIGQNLMI